MILLTPAACLALQDYRRACLACAALDVPGAGHAARIAAATRALDALDRYMRASGILPPSRPS
jgi:hypothetical protein